MCDRTHVTLTVPKACSSDAERIMEEEGYSFDEGPEELADDRELYQFWEVNYDTLPFLDALQAAGIAFDSEWGAGGDYSAGCESLRFTPEGEAQRIELFEGGENPSIHALMAVIDYPQQLRAFILEHKEATTPLPWDHQAEYGKLYRARQLIAPKEAS